MKKIIVIAFALVVASCAQAASVKKEKDYQRAWCSRHKGRVEVVLDDGARVDCVTATHAVEFDYAKKWAEGIGQALFYGAKTGKKAGVVLITGPKDAVRVERARWLIKALDLQVDLWTVKK